MNKNFNDNCFTGFGSNLIPHTLIEVIKSSKPNENKLKKFRYMKKSDDIVKRLLKEGYSAQDISHIGLRVMMSGTYLWTKKGVEHCLDDFKEVK